MATMRTFRIAAPVEFALQRWLEFVSSAGRAGTERIVRNVWHYRGSDGRWFSWKYVSREVPDEVTSAKSVDRTARIAAKRNAAPSWDDIIHVFGEQGAVRNEAGKVVGYKYPEPKTDEARRRQNEIVYEMWNPQRRMAIEMGSQVSAETPMTKLVDPATGREFQVATVHAEKKAKKAGLVEKRPRIRARKTAG